MSEQQAPSNNNSNNNNQRRNNNRRRHHNKPRDNAQQGDRPQGQNPQGQQRQPQHANQQQRQHNNQNQQGPSRQGNNPNQKRRPQHNNNRPRPQGNHPQHNNQGGFSIERIYEKYLNLLDQHIVARRKYHDLFYRADPAQKNKLERNFYNTLNDIREFEAKLAPDVKVLFEKRNNGYQPDRIYTSNHELPIEGDTVPEDIAPAEPHLLQSQINADYSNDTEESVGTAEDYLKYKGL